MNENIILSKTYDFALRIIEVYKYLSKEARETHYWIRLLRDSDYIDSKLASSLITDLDEILRIIGAILKTVSGK